jgi:hypothetical protein
VKTLPNYCFQQGLHLFLIVKILEPHNYIYATCPASAHRFPPASYKGLPGCQNGIYPVYKSLKQLATPLYPMDKTFLHPAVVLYP